jgi:hypothetical protein
LIMLSSIWEGQSTGQTWPELSSDKQLHVDLPNNVWVHGAKGRYVFRGTGSMARDHVAPGLPMWVHGRMRKGHVPAWHR